jgi:nodulation protein E
MQQVVITGIGVISALGKNHTEFWQALCDGRSGIAPIQQIDCSGIRFQQGAEVKNYDARLHFNLKHIAYLDRFAQFALISAREAVADAGLSKEELANGQTAIVTGSAMGGKKTEDEGFDNC